MKIIYAACALALGLCAVTPVFAQTPTQKSTEDNAASAGGSAGSIGPDKSTHTTSAQTKAEAKQAAIGNRSAAHSSAGAGSQE
jgi:hypothetical protein